LIEELPAVTRLLWLDPLSTLYGSRAAPAAIFLSVVTVLAVGVVL
jgi:hypothetical protein